jgi:hypothetical protein
VGWWLQLLLRRRLGGSLDILTPAALAIDAATARSNGSYQKLWYNLERLQRLNDRWSVNASLSGQWASKNLDPSEDFVLGGIDGVRSYRQGEGFGDEGYIASLEARFLLTGLSARVPGEVHLLAFADTGHIRINAKPWNDLPNERDLSGAGVGLSWEDPGNFALRTYYAFRLGGDDALSSDNDSGHFWIQAVNTSEGSSMNTSVRMQQNPLRTRGGLARNVLAAAVMFAIAGAASARPGPAWRRVRKPRVRRPSPLPVPANPPAAWSRPARRRSIRSATTPRSASPARTSSSTGRASASPRARPCSSCSRAAVRSRSTACLAAIPR